MSFGHQSLTMFNDSISLILQKPKQGARHKQQVMVELKQIHVYSIMSMAMLRSGTRLRKLYPDKVSSDGAPVMCNHMTHHCDFQCTGSPDMEQTNSHVMMPHIRKHKSRGSYCGTTG